MNNMLIRTAVVAVVTVFSATSALHAENPAGTMPPGMDEAMMARMREFITPNESHRALDYFVGNWSYTAKMWMTPDSPVDESAGTAETKWIMDGRFLEEIFNGTMMGAPFIGRMTLGHDNLKNKYVSTWIDNMSTGLMTSEGDYDPAAKVFSETGRHSCPIDGIRHFRAATKILDENTYTYETYVQQPGGGEYKNMEIVYERK